ncbi:MAG: hypothetical protein HN742_34980 [Lentisphaerae bacterium]|jgi:lysophospholipase L1-like esterase|nr:hypothetical protein [Lentisphaerota bacterium]MBT4815428.1 hypothetical protein [Lentisphaerota bacterium]MBT5609226.1 hypothetical protein [Lentisphaerota bacterium]MBT7059895.1 hypothetical protein [Lentisphaerota bacterium]MBT7847128.1 hypothetical protein [Lentisphaerota bacterium]
MRPMRFFLAAAGFTLANSLLIHGAPVVLHDFEDLTGWRVSRKPAEIAEADGAAVGKGAIRVTLPGMASLQLTRTYLPGSHAWDRYQGVSFWVKGDGSEQFGCLALQGRYAFVTYFPLSNTEWHKLTVPWSELVPESQVDPIGTPGSMPPSGINTIRFGSRWTIYHNNAKIPEHTFCIDQIQLEEEVAPAPPVPAPRPFADVLELLKQRKPIRIQCMGDSITAGTGLGNRDMERYATLVQRDLRQWLGTDDIHCLSKAVGGARSTDARAWVPRDYVGEAPDLVTMWYGYNDKSGAFTRDYYKRSLKNCVDRVLRATAGKSAVLLFATGPGCGPRFVMLDDYAEAARELAEERGLPCFDVNRLLKGVGRDKIQDFFCDMAHPNAEGHKLIADGLCEFLIKEAGIKTPKPAPPPRPDVPEGEARSWPFATPETGWRFDSKEITHHVDTEGNGAIHVDMPAPARDHRRAYSPALPVIPGQRYRIEADVRIESMQDGHMGLYVCTYTDEAGTFGSVVHQVRSRPGPPRRWERFSKSFDIPEGTGSIRVLVWSNRESSGTFQFRAVSVKPE